MSFPARIRRIDRPARGVIAISLSGAHGRFVLLVSHRAEAPGAAIVEDRPRGAPADGFTSMLRQKLVGAAVTEVRGAGGTTEIALLSDEGPLRLVLATGGPSGSLALYDEAGRPRLSSGKPTCAFRALPALGFDELRARGEPLARSLAGAENAERRAALSRAIDRARRRLARKLTAIEGDAARAARVPELRADAAALLSSLHAIPRGATRFEATDYASDPPRKRSIALDPALAPRAQAEALFKKARRLERGATIAQERAAAATAAIASLEELSAAIPGAGPKELGALENRAAALGVRSPREAPSRPEAPAARRPFRTFVSSEGRTVLVGRSAADNDELTLRTARPHDLWLHARGASGSHVVVPLERDRTCPPQTLAEAAMLAAHFSRFRDDARVEVIYTPRRYVRKRRGAKPGSVAVEREKVLLVAMDRGRLAILLGNERK